MEDDLYEELTDMLVQMAHPYAVGTVMSTWEVKFCADMRQRHERWGKEIRMTDKQWTVMRRIKEKIDAAD